MDIKTSESGVFTYDISISPDSLLLRKFMQDNNLKFLPGQRNSDAVILCGFALYKNISFKDIVEATNNYCSMLDIVFNNELERVYNFAKSKNYGDWWNKDEAKKLYKF